VSTRVPASVPAVALALAFAGGLALPAGLAAAPRPLVHDVAQADSLVLTRASAARDRALVDWAKRAPVDDLLWLLRRPPVELGTAELGLVATAIDRVADERVGLRERLLARHALALPRMVKRGQPPLPSLRPLRPYASVFRVAALLPDSGDYAAYAGAVRLALAAGLASERSPGAFPLELDTLGTGDSDPVRLADAFERVRPDCDVVVGELLSVPTLALATAARTSGLTLVSPTATDERLGRVGPTVFRIGPSPVLRARVLADAVLGSAARRVAISGSADGIHGAFADAFAAEVESRGGRVVRREVTRTHPEGAAQLAASFKASGAEVLLWDGPARDAESLLRALAAAGASLQLCGGPALAPEGMRPTVRSLLEGVVWVDDDWRLSPVARANVDSLATAAGSRPGALWTRGYLAGRLIARAVDGGARAADEVAAALRHHDPVLAVAGYVDVSVEGATLPLRTARGGKAVEYTRLAGQ